MGKKVTPADTLGIIEAIIEERARFVPFGPFSDMETMELERFPIDFSDEKYRREFFARFRDRLAFVKSRETEKAGSTACRGGEAALRKALDEIGYPVQD